MNPYFTDIPEIEYKLLITWLRFFPSYKSLGLITLPSSIPIAMHPFLKIAKLLRQINAIWDCLYFVQVPGLILFNNSHNSTPSFISSQKLLNFYNIHIMSTFTSYSKIFIIILYPIFPPSNFALRARALHLVVCWPFSALLSLMLTFQSFVTNKIKEY